jgi:hypothetical protein
MTELKLYDIPTAISEALEAVDLETGEIAPNLQEVVAASHDKLANTARWIKTRSVMVSAIEDTIKNLQARAKAEKRRIEWIEKMMLDGMTALNVQKIETPDILVKAQKTPASVVILDEEQIPQEFIKTKTELSVDKVGIKNAIKAGQDVPGAMLQSGMKISIK